jgi:hypothetical protein
MKNIQDGMIQAGMIDKACQTYPDAYQIIYGTTRRDVSIGEWDTIVKAFPALFAEYMKEGRIKDEMLLQHGLPPDTDPRGRVVSSRDSDCISRQRAQTITHNQRVKERHMKQQEAMEVVRLEMLKRKAVRKQILEDGQKCETGIKENMSRRVPNSGNATLLVENAARVDFISKPITLKTITAPLLEAFIYCRDPEKKTKGVAKAQLIEVAFELRQKPVSLMEQDATAEAHNSNETSTPPPVPPILR